MKSKNQNSKRIALLFVLVVISIGAMAQVGPYPEGAILQMVNFDSNEPYGVINDPSSTYTWTITPIDGGTITGNSNTISVHWTSAGTYTVQVIEKNSLLCDGDPITMTVTVLPELTAGTAAANQTICYNTIPAALTSVDPSGGTGTYTYQWQSSPDNSTFTDISGATSSGYAPEVLTATTYYRLQQTSGTSGAVATNVVTITVLPNLLAGTASADESICYNSNPAAITATAPTGGNGSYTYQWESSADNLSFADISGATNLTYAPDALTATTYFRLKQTSGADCGTVTTNTITKTVNPLPVVSINGPTQICATTSGHVYTTETGMSDYVWTISAGGTITAGGTATDHTVTVTWMSSGTQTVSANYTNGTNCSATNPTIQNVTVDPLPATSAIYHN
ncbi:MAG TPA: hypothetical protein VFC65_04360 [Prolixibacteraceae bacterium]|nr:hypothetical protein [Prolixibacteraceae bacterium]